MKKRQLVYSSFVLVIVLLLAAVSISAAQQPGPGKQLPVDYPISESASPAANYTESEPNNSVATADVFPAGNVISGIMNVSGDVDYFRYTGGSGYLIIDVDSERIGSVIDPLVCVVGQGCIDDSHGLDPMLYVDGNQTFYIVDISHIEGPSGPDTFYKIMVYRPLLVSAAVNGTVSGVPFNKSDILAHYDFPGGVEKWSMFFDASDVNITQNINALVVSDPDNFLMTVQANQPLLGTGLTATPFDLISFTPENLGEETSGILDRPMRGSQEGLSASGEKIDALAWGPYWYSMSTVGTLKIPKWPTGTFTAQDEDIIDLDNESGWSVSPNYFLDGSTVTGLGIEDITAAANGAANYTYDDVHLVIQGTGKVGGLRVTQKDIFVLDTVTKQVQGYFWRGGQHHFPFNLDAIDLSGYFY